MTTTPSQISVGPGQSPGFQASVMVENCTGHSGPFPTTPIWFGPRSPFQWDGTHVSTTAGADRDLIFEGYVLETDDNCFPRFYRRRGDGRAKACKMFCNPQCYSETVTCAQQTAACSLCFRCCRDTAFTAICKGQEVRSAQIAFNICKIGCVTDVGCDGANQFLPPISCTSSF